MEKNYHDKIREELVEHYRTLCFELGKDKEAENIPNSKEELTKKYV